MQGMGLKKAALIALAGGALSLGGPASAASIDGAVNAEGHATRLATFEKIFPAPLGDMSFEHKRKRHHHRDWDDDDYYEARHYGHGYGEPVYRDTRIWRGRNGRYYCRKRDGTTGLIIGGAAGALLGREVAGPYGDRTLGAILGGAAGALLGRAIDRGGMRCR